MTRWSCVALLSLGLGGCATTHPAPRTAKQQYSGRPYDVWDEGSRVTGSVCGVTVDYAVARSERGHTILNGFFDGGTRSSYLEVTPTARGRHISGSTGARAGLGEIDLYVDDDRIHGRAGRRDFDLRAHGDALAGKMTILGSLGTAPVVVDGRTQLGQLPSADLAAILPPLLNCGQPPGNRMVRPYVTVGIGGPAGYETRSANALD